MNIEQHTHTLKQFRQQLYQAFIHRADTLTELVDAICSYPDANSIVEYSLAACFRRTYSNISKAIDEFDLGDQTIASLAAPYLPEPQKQPFHLLATDVTPQPRPFAQTLADRGMVYQPNAVAGNKPVTIGHQYSSVVLLPEPEEGITASWVVPLDTQRVATDEDKEAVGCEQIKALLDSPHLPFSEQFCVDVGDSAYSKVPCLHSKRAYGNLVSIARLNGTRTLYQPYKSEASTDNIACKKSANSSGRKTVFGKRFSLKEPETWHEPDVSLTIEETSRRGKKYRYEIKAWHNMLMRGKNKPYRMPMEKYPFTLVLVQAYNEEGQLLRKRPMWLIAIGERRHELTVSDIFHAYARRSDIEHFFRFSKQKLCLDNSQTPDVTREESWWCLAHLAYFQLWLARYIAECLPRPWERCLPQMKKRLRSPTLVQRDFGRIIRQVGTPAKPPKPRNNGAGRPPGTTLSPRPRQKVVVKGKQTAQQA
jgi:hypothetical protein